MWFELAKCKTINSVYYVHACFDLDTTLTLDCNLLDVNYNRKHKQRNRKHNRNIHANKPAGDSLLDEYVFTKRASMCNKLRSK